MTLRVEIYEGRLNARPVWDLAEERAAKTRGRQKIVVIDSRRGFRGQGVFRGKKNGLLLNKPLQLRSVQMTRA